MNKKAQTDTILNWVFYRLPIMVIIVVFFSLILTYHYMTGLNSYDVEYLVINSRLTYSPNLLAYQDKITGRVYPGTIDLGKFDTANLEKNINNNDGRVAVNLELTNLETNDIKRAYLNEKKAKAWDDYVLIGGYDLSVQNRYVKIYDDGAIYPGMLKTKVLIKQ
jgi:hypothetical protein